VLLPPFQQIICSWVRTWIRFHRLGLHRFIHCNKQIHTSIYHLPAHAFTAALCLLQLPKSKLNSQLNIYSFPGVLVGNSSNSPHMQATQQVFYISNCEFSVVSGGTHVLLMKVLASFYLSVSTFSENSRWFMLCVIVWTFTLWPLYLSLAFFKGNLPFRSAHIPLISKCICVSGVFLYFLFAYFLFGIVWVLINVF